jgi:hypothetical protein
VLISPSRCRRTESIVSLEIHAFLTETLGEHAPSYATVKKWVAQFERGDFSTFFPLVGLRTYQHPGTNWHIRILTKFLHGFNNVCPNLVFTSEQEQNSSTNLIDITVGRYITNSKCHCKFAIYRKPTATGWVIRLNFGRPKPHNLAPVRYFNSRSNTCSLCPHDQETTFLYCKIISLTHKLSVEKIWIGMKIETNIIMVLIWMASETVNEFIVHV